jgi:putative mRNA 3-end processing factor
MSTKNPDKTLLRPGKTPAGERTSPDDDLILLTDRGLYCPPGDFYIDAWKPVPLTIVTHGHSDHAHYGNERYIGEINSLPVLRLRVGRDAKIEGRAYGEEFFIRDVKISLHPAGHILGSSQVRVEHEGRVWVFTGDCKRDEDPSCEPFEVVKCDTFITEATFALPIYQWKPTREVAGDIAAWWLKNRARGWNSILCCYALGKAQRVLAELARLPVASEFEKQPVYLHGAMENMTRVYRNAGIKMVPTQSSSIFAKNSAEISTETSPENLGASVSIDANGKKKRVPKNKIPREKITGGLILAPPSASGSTWTRKFEPYEVGFASGWMAIRGNKRRKAYDRGFVISDHSDWPSLIQTITDTGAKRVIATHGSSDVLARYVRENMGLLGETFQTQYGDEETDEKTEYELKNKLPETNSTFPGKSDANFADGGHAGTKNDLHTDSPSGTGVS